jgi:hypothetical protein
MIVESAKSIDNEGRDRTASQDKDLDKIDATSLVWMMAIKSATV